LIKSVERDIIRFVGLWKKLLLLVLAVPAYAGPNGIYEPLVKWSKNEVKVCWSYPIVEGETFNVSEKLAVKSVIQREFTAERTGIYFTGFEDCAAAPDSDVFVYTGNSDPNPKRKHDSGGLLGESEIGEGGTVVDEKSDEGFTYKKKKVFYMMYLYSNRQRKVPNADYLYALKVTALHEFGHLAGLRHEHVWAEAQSDFNCRLHRKGDVAFNTQEPIFKSTQVATAYDSNSIMNYCWDDQLNANGPKFYYIRDMDAFHASGHGPIEEPGLKLPPDFMPTLTDDTLYKITKDYIPGIDVYDIKLGLSAGDVKAVQCMYKQDKIADISTCKQEKPKKWISI